MTVLETGSKVAGYRVLELLRRGGSGAIYMAQDDRDGSRIALKIPDSSYLGDIPSWERFRREVALARRLKHPLIADIRDASDDPAQPYLAVEFVDGVDLEQYVAQQGRLPIEQSLDIIIRMLQALQYIHEQKVIHRDLKPANIMIQPDGTPKLVDFGIAKPLDMKRITWKGFSKSFGTPSYMAPEQVNGSRITPATDIYAMGIILYELLAGKPPFEGDNAFQVMKYQTDRPPAPIHTLRPDVPPWLEAVVMRALEKKPQHRYQSAAEMMEDLQQQRTPSPIPEADRSGGAPGMIWAVLGGAVCVVVVIIVLALIHHH